jgi:hypothetical protein
LAFCDSAAVNFLPGGEFQLHPQTDSEAAALLGSDFPAFIEEQKNRLKENAINNKTACALLSAKIAKRDLAKDRA